MEQTWFVTGSSRGLGRALARAAPPGGDLVAATARQPAELDDLVAEYGERIYAIGLDVTDAAAARSAVGGRVATSADWTSSSTTPATPTSRPSRPLTTRTSALSSRPTSGRLPLSKAAIPLLFREQVQGGLFMQISSVGGRVGGSPGIASYQAAKFAIDGFSRVLRAETAPFGVRVMVVEPSGFRTDWAGSSMTVDDIPEAYAQTIGAMNSRVRQSNDGPEESPGRGAAILVQVAKRRISRPPASRGERRRRLDPARPATHRRGPQMEPLARSADSASPTR